MAAAPDPMPGDEVVPGARLVMDRGLHLPATPETVWPWLEQLGKERAGWYLPRPVERLVPSRRRAIRYVDPAYLGLSPGDQVPDWGPGDPTFEVVAVRRPEHLVYRSVRPRRARRGREQPPMVFSWALRLTPVEDQAELRLRFRGDLGHEPGPLPRYAGGAVDWLTVALMGRGLAERLRESRS